MKELPSTFKILCPITDEDWDIICFKLGRAARLAVVEEISHNGHYREWNKIIRMLDRILLSKDLLMNIISEQLKTIKTGSNEEFTLVRYKSAVKAPWNYGLLLEPNDDCDGCDVDELDETTAIDIMGRLFNIHIYDDDTNVSRL